MNEYLKQIETGMTGGLRDMTRGQVVGVNQAYETTEIQIGADGHVSKKHTTVDSQGHKKVESLDADDIN